MTKPDSSVGRRLSILAAAAALLLVGCGSDERTPGLELDDLQRPPDTAAAPTTTSPFDELTAEARDWCRFTGSTLHDANRFDLIFEAGLRLGLNMDVVNALAGGRRQELEDEGLSADEAVRAVSEELFADPTFVAACVEAYDIFGDDS